MRVILRDTDGDAWLDPADAKALVPLLRPFPVDEEVKRLAEMGIEIG
jgi:putative SOS response-associated peptidase YedK